jgi:glutathione peroxidase
MRPIILAAMVLAQLLAPATRADDPGDAYGFSFTMIDGKPLPLSTFRGKAVLLVNTASQCGFTPQYTELEQVWTRYRDRGLVVLGVPSNDFGGQEPGNEAEIRKFCQANYNVDFPLTAKNVVTGDAAHPFYRWAATVLGPDAVPKWNFHKYLIDPKGRLVAWFPSKVKPDAPEVTHAIEAALPAKG